MERQRRPANAIDHDDNPYKAIASVLMFKEGWDGGDVTTIVGPRAFSSNSAILPGQILGRAPMGPGGGGTTPLAIESDRDHPSKDLAALDIPLPILSPRVVRQPNALTALALEAILFQPLPWLTGPTPPHPKKGGLAPSRNGVSFGIRLATVEREAISSRSRRRPCHPPRERLPSSQEGRPRCTRW
ncbi:MAG: hypothetical protein ACK41W_05540 [Cyanobacteriota bacterium]